MFKLIKTFRVNKEKKDYYLNATESIEDFESNIKSFMYDTNQKIWELTFKNVNDSTWERCFLGREDDINYKLLILQKSLKLLIKFMDNENADTQKKLINSLSHEIILIDNINKLYKKGINFLEQEIRDSTDIIFSRLTLVLEHYKKGELEVLSEELEITKQLRYGMKERMKKNEGY